MSQLWSWVCSSSVFVLRRAGGPVSFRGCEGGRGASQLRSWVCFEASRRGSQLRGCEGGRGASQLWSWVCSSSVFVLRRAGGPVSFRGCEGGRGASQLWSWVCSSSVFVLRRAGGPVSFFRLACPTFDTCQEVCSVRKGFCQEGILSGRNFVREEFCQAGILPGSGLCRKRALPGRSFGVCLLLGGTV